MTAAPSPWKRLVQVGAAYLLLYAASNHLTSLRRDVGDGVFDWEQAIPFVAASIVPYLSIFVLFVVSFFVGRDPRALDRHCARLLLALAIAVVGYLAFPLEYTFDRPMPSGIAGLAFQALWTIDLPFNRAPSLHIAVLVLLWARFWPLTVGVWRPALAAWMAAIGVSVLTTYQHHVIDVASGLAVGAVCLAQPPAWLQRFRVARASPPVSRGVSGLGRRLPSTIVSMKTRSPFVVSAALLGMAALLGHVGTAHAAAYTGRWDPAYGSIFPSLGWRAEAVFEVPDACLALGDGSSIPISGDCAGFDVLSAQVELYDIADPLTTLGTYGLDTDVIVTGIALADNRLAGVDTGFFDFFVPALPIAGGGAYSFSLILFGGDQAQLIYAQPIATSPGCAFLPVSGASCGISATAAQGVFAPVLPPIPEPETYALMLAGLGALTFAARRRRGETRQSITRPGALPAR